MNYFKRIKSAVPDLSGTALFCFMVSVFADGTGLSALFSLGCMRELDQK